MPLLRYLSTLDHRRIVLWGAGIWYAALAVRYAERDAALWLRALGIAAIVGSMLVLNAVPTGGRIRDVGFWPAFRFFLVPFCVSSFAAFTKGHPFLLIFPTDLAANTTPLGALAVFGLIVWIAKKTSAR
ncbi:MAG: hypothetical protein HZA93_25770 [Verrucomicrobia bacterium]|nr:hypothetical protein [Verrucomicrobiota bacterium]